MVANSILPRGPAVARDGSLPIHVTELELAAALTPILRPLDTVVMEGGWSIAGVLGC